MNSDETYDQPKSTGFFSQFTKMFWVVNSLELFERGAYYGTMAVLSVHVVQTLLGGGDNAEAIWGALYAMLIILLYFVPLASAALSEKYGYKNILLPAFGIMIIGYFLLSFVRPNQLAFLTFALIFLGIGAGAFKPIISGTIAHVTLESQRSLAYSIYYWTINLGACLFPFLIGFIFPTLDIFHFVFLISAVLIGINIVITFFIYENPIAAQPQLAIGKAIKRIIPALKDRKFAILLIIYSGFWFMFAFNHTFLPVYMIQFHRMPTWFVVAWLATINPGTIIILGPFLGKLVEKYKSLNVMMVGIIIFCIGLVITGFSNIQALFVLGIIIFSIGEFITHPGFIAYVSKIAPKKMLTIYMACIFISTGLGNAAGGVVQGLWYSYFSKSLLMPKVYIALVASVGLLTLIGFIFYNRWIIKETLKTDPGAKVDRGIFTKTMTAGIVLLFIPVTIYGAYLGGTDVLYQEEPSIPITDWSKYNVVTIDFYTEDGYSNENTEIEIIVEIEDPNIKTITFILTWEDEQPSSTRHINGPDNLQLDVDPPEGPPGSAGAIDSMASVSVNFEFEPQNDPYFNGTGQYNVTIICGNCGDHELWRPSIGLQDEPDDGNAWNLEIKYEYYSEPEE